MNKTQIQKASSKTPPFLVHALFATGRNGEMGNKDGSLPWRTKNNKIREDLPEQIKKQCAEDMSLFKTLTTGNIIIMGYNTWKTFPAPLPDRINIVIDRNVKVREDDGFSQEGWNFFPSIEEALSACSIFNRIQNLSPKEVYIIGGAKLLHEAFSKKLITGKIFHTVIDEDFPEADVFFTPEQNP